MSWKLRIWCGDCSFGQDPQGCFDGGEEVLDETFATKEEAEAHGLREGHGNGPYEFEAFEYRA